MNPAGNDLDTTPRPHRFVLYLPVGEPAGSHGDLIRVIETLLCERFGGVTSYPAVGLFKRSSGVLQREPVQVLESFCEVEVWEAEGAFMVAIAGAVAEILAQESVAFSLDGRMHLAEPRGEAARAYLEERMAAAGA